MQRQKGRGLGLHGKELAGSSSEEWDSGKAQGHPCLVPSHISLLSLVNSALFFKAGHLVVQLQISA